MKNSATHPTPFPSLHRRAVNMDFNKMSKSQKTLCGIAVSYIVYGAMFIGAPLGLEDSGLKFTGVKSGPITQAAANWAGVGAILLGLDNIFVALKCSKEMIQRTVSVNAIGCIIRLGVFITAGSQNWGGVHVHKEYLQGLAISVAILAVCIDCLRDGYGKAKHPFMGCNSLTHGALIVPTALMMIYIGIMLTTDFIGDNYIVPKGGLRAAEPNAYTQMAWTFTMWFGFMMQNLVVLGVGKAGEQREFSLLRVLSVLVAMKLMTDEKSITPPNKQTEGMVVQAIMLVAYVVAAFGDKIKPASKKKAPARGASKKRK